MSFYLCCVRGPFKLALLNEMPGINNIDFKKRIRKVLKGEDLTLLEQTTQLTHTPSYVISLKKLPWRFYLLNGTWLYYKTILCPLLIYNVQPRHSLYLMSKWHLIQPLQREIYKSQHLSWEPWRKICFFFCHMELLSLINCKSRNVSGDSSSNMPEFKRRKEKQELEDLQEVLDILMILEDAEAEQSDVVLTALHMAQRLS